MKTRLEIMCNLHKQQGGTIHQFNDMYKMQIEVLNNREFFKLIFGAALKQCHQNYPSDYVWPESELMYVFERMCAAIDKGTFNKDSRAFKLTCKLLEIPHTYKAIKEYIK